MEINLEYLEYTKEEIPVSKRVSIDGRLYVLEIQYNEVGDFYTAHIYDNKDELLLTSKLVYMQNIININNTKLPSKKIVPLDLDDLSAEYPQNLRVNSATFGDKVRLYII